MEDGPSTDHGWDVPAGISLRRWEPPLGCACKL